MSYIPSITTSSGSYTPTFNNASGNITAVSGTVAQYSQVGNVVTVSGEFTVSSTLAINSTFDISLPVASTIVSTFFVAGTGVSDTVANTSARILGNTATNTARASFDTALVAAVFSYHFTYRII